MAWYFVGLFVAQLMVRIFKLRGIIAWWLGNKKMPGTDLQSDTELR